MANTNDTEDLRYLDRIISKHPTRYKKLVPSEKLREYTYYKAWQYIERGKYYVKIDDDIVRFLPSSEKYVRLVRSGLTCHNRSQGLD